MYAAYPCVMDPRGLKATQNSYFSLLIPIKQLLLVTFCNMQMTTGTVKCEGMDCDVKV